MSEEAATLTRGLEQLDAVMATKSEDDARTATPCSEYDVEQLVDHLVEVADRVYFCLADEPGPNSSTWAEASARLRKRLGEGVPDRVLDLPFGRMPAVESLPVFFAEFVAHTWDLAVALEQTQTLDDELGEKAFAVFTASLPSAPRDELPFDEVIPVPEDAPVYTRLAGWLGRRP